VTAPVAIRVNPDVDAMTLAQITTGTRDNKFGIDIEQAPEVYALARTLPGIDPCALAMHIGSQVTRLEPFRDAYTRVAGLTRALRAQGFPISRLDLGGGFAITYRDETPTDLTGFARLIRDIVGPLGCQVILEPGRVLVGNAGLLVTRVIYVKTELARDFVIVDGAMNDLIRPALYKAWHDILPVREPPPGAPAAPYDVVGPVCESSDSFGQARPLTAPAAGDLLAFASAGAYGASMASTYNARPLVPEVLVDGHRFAIVRKRPTFEDTVALERLPPWLDGG
jgi:diaminopimelate decarboxylase